MQNLFKHLLKILHINKWGYHKDVFVNLDLIVLYMFSTCDIMLYWAILHRNILQMKSYVMLTNCLSLALPEAIFL